MTTCEGLSHFVCGWVGTRRSYASRGLRVATVESLETKSSLRLGVRPVHANGTPGGSMGGMECIVETATSSDGVLDVAAVALDDCSKHVRFRLPSELLQWSEGQRFFCTVGDGENAPRTCRTATVTLRALVVERTQTKTLVSVGGLAMSLPLSIDSDEVSIHLVASGRSKRRHP